MFNRVIKTAFLAAIFVFGLAACGGGGSGNSSNSSGGSSQKSTSGPIASFGSIYVNGVRYDTSNASIYIEDKTATESDLRAGMFVYVTKDGNGGAASVEFDDALEGIVTANNIAAGQTTGTMDIMGQLVTVDNNTVFDSDVPAITSIDQVAAGNIVEVSGFITGSASLTATRIEVKATSLANYLASHPEGIEIKGEVANHSAANQTFDLGNLTVNYAGADMSKIPGGISNTLYVEVKSVQGMNVANELVASSVELEDNGKMGHDGDEDDEYEVQGVVVAASAGSVTVGGQTFQINAQTSYDNGIASDLKPGVMVEVEGQFDQAGTLVAKEIEFKTFGTTSKLLGVVASVSNPAGDNNGTVTLVNGTVILVTFNTIMHDDRDVGQTPNMSFNLSDLVAGDYIEVYATDNGDGTYTAIKLEREDPPSP